MNTALQSVTTKPLPLPGTPMQGGFFAGVVQLDGQQYGVIVSPKAQGETTGPWGERGKSIDGATHIGDGLSNTKAMAEAGSAIAQKALAADINDCQDWYIPARDELELIYRNLKPGTKQNICWFRDGENLCSVPMGYKYLPNSPAQTPAAEFQSGGAEALEQDWYWSSTQYSASYAFVQDFSDGTQRYGYKGNDRPVRLVRRIIIN